MHSILRARALTFIFLWFALGGNLFLFQGLSLGMLSPPAQLKVDKFPHHEGLSEADSGQDSYPRRKKKSVNLQKVNAKNRMLFLSPL